MNKGILFFTKAVALLIFTGCANNPLLTTNLNQQSTESSLIFKTNPSTFITDLNTKTTQKGRNEYINEFILKSDMQCRSYLNASKVKAKATDLTQNQLYMNIFDTVSMVFGLSYVTNTAKAMLSGDMNSNLQNQQEYKKALSPEIQQGVEINRERYAKKIKRKTPLSINDYSIPQLQKDLSVYDKQCNEAYGLIEINRALKAMQQNLNQHQQRQKVTINVEAVKNSVTQATKKVQAKKIQIKKNIEQKGKENNATTQKL